MNRKPSTIARDLYFHNVSGAIPSRFVDYIDAGVSPLGPSNFTLFKRFAHKYGIEIEVDVDVIFTQKFWRDLRQRLLSESIDFSYAREALSIDRHAPRLAKFYQQFRQ